jgi:hypothetical protein
VTNAFSDSLSLWLQNFNLATKINSLARFSKRTIQLLPKFGQIAVTEQWLSDFKFFSILARGTFQLSLAVLFRYRT